MDPHEELNLAIQAFETLLEMCDPQEALSWHPSDEQRNAYVNLAERALEGLDKFERIECSQILSEGRLQSFVPEDKLSFVRERMKPRVAAMRAALDHFDPNGKSLRDILPRS